MHGPASRLVLFRQRNVKSSACQKPGAIQTARSATYYNDISHHAILSRLDFFSTMFPLAAECNPEGKHNESDVSNKALFFNVQAIEPEFLAPRKVAGGENLSQAG